MNTMFMNATSYPWTNLDNINLDWFINQMQNTLEKFDYLTVDYQKMQEWVVKELHDMSQEIEERTGEETVTAIVERWLQQHPEVMIADRSVTSQKLALEAVETENIKDGSVSYDKLAPVIVNRIGKIENDLTKADERLTKDVETINEHMKADPVEKTDIVQKLVNGAGLFDSNNGVATYYFPVRKGDIIKVNTADKLNSIFAWKDEVIAKNCYLTQTWKNINQELEIAENGIAVVQFKKPDGSTFMVEEYNCKVEHISVFWYEAVKQQLKTITDDCESIHSVIDNTVTLTFELGGLNTNTGQPMNAQNRARSLMFYLSRNMRVASTDDEYAFRCLQYSKDGTKFLKTLNTSNMSEFDLEGGYNYRLLIFPATVTDLTTHIKNITANIVVMVKKSVYTVAKDGTGDFTDIQHCLDFIPKTTASTIIIKPGTYDKICTLTQKKYVDDTSGNKNNKWYNRKINLIGLEQKDCIIKSTTGEYYTPAAEICITGEVRNLSFISDHTTPPSDRSLDPNYLKHKAYAVHSDAGTEDVLYDHCTMISYQAPGIGIGGAKNKKIRLRNCHIESYAPSNGEYAPLVNYGGLFYHLMTGDGITGQYFELENNYIYSESGNYATFITPSTATNYEQETHLRNNCFYGNTCKKTVNVNTDMLHDDSYGNNVTSLNK